jgi:hypothetical protein
VEAVFPISKRGIQPPEDFSISLFPYFPGSNGEDFHEEAKIEVLLGFLQSVKEAEVMIPEDSKISPAIRAEGALED